MIISDLSHFAVVSEASSVVGGFFDVTFKVTIKQRVVNFNSNITFDGDVSTPELSSVEPTNPRAVAAVTKQNGTRRAFAAATTGS